MKRLHRLPDVTDFEVEVGGVPCPFCESTNVAFASMTGGAANELLMRCSSCKSFFFTLKDLAFLEIGTFPRSESGRHDG